MSEDAEPVESFDWLSALRRDGEGGLYRLQSFIRYE